MKIAFVGKGGSGKSTVSALFTHHLINNNQRVLAVDADINQHFASLIGAPFKKELALSNTNRAAALREHLRGTNERIPGADVFVKTTPPGKGSRLIQLDSSDSVIAAHSTAFAKNGYFMHVGTYEEEGVGTSCYHGNLAVFENIISHTKTRQDEWLIGDMVAGTDAFASALYLLFDVIFMVVEPTPESVGVFKQFKDLAEKSGMSDRVFAIGNKVADDEDEVYLRNAVGNKLIAILPQDTRLRKIRQQGSTVKLVGSLFSEQLASIQAFALDHRADDDETLARLYELHLRYAAQDYVKNKHGDISGQIDPTFHYAAT